MRRGVTMAWLLALWLVLWRDVSVANVLSGLVIAAVASGHLPWKGQHGVRPVALVLLLGHFARRLIEANLVLAREVVTPTNKIQTGIVAVRLPDCSDLVVTMVANATSLTPGTLTLEISHHTEPVIYVHVLHLRSVEEARADVLDLAARFAHAFPRRTDPTSTGPTSTGEPA